MNYKFIFVFVLRHTKEINRPGKEVLLIPSLDFFPYRLVIRCSRDYFYYGLILFNQLNCY